MSNFTQGPWQTHYAWDQTGYPVYSIHGVSGSAKSHEPTLQANANLIAAAPEMYEALKGMMTLMCNVRDLYGVPAAQWFIKSMTWSKAAAAIAKAEGK